MFITKLLELSQQMFFDNTAGRKSFFTATLLATTGDGTSSVDGTPSSGYSCCKGKCKSLPRSADAPRQTESG